MLRIIGDGLHTVKLPGIKRRLFIFWPRQVDINKSTDICSRWYQLVFNSIGVKVMEQLAQLLLGRVPDMLIGQLFDCGLQISNFNRRKFFAVQLRALPEGDVIVFCGCG